MHLLIFAATQFTKLYSTMQYIPSLYCNLFIKTFCIPQITWLSTVCLFTCSVLTHTTSLTHYSLKISRGCFWSFWVHNPCFSICLSTICASVSLSVCLLNKTPHSLPSPSSSSPPFSPPPVQREFTAAFSLPLERTQIYLPLHPSNHGSICWNPARGLTSNVHTTHDVQHIPFAVFSKYHDCVQYFEVLIAARTFKLQDSYMNAMRGIWHIL